MGVVEEDDSRQQFTGVRCQMAGLGPFIDVNIELQEDLARLVVTSELHCRLTF
eukprot:SAG31_NODE_4365_length_3307_cov_10.960723_3_plen_53_part_00